MRYSRVAVECGGAIMRVAGAEPGGPPGVLAECPVDAAPDAAEQDVLARLVLGRDVLGPAGALDAPCEDLVLVHPAGWTTTRVARAALHLTPLARRVHTVAAPVAAAGERGAHVVFDVGRAAAEATLVEDGTVVIHRHRAVGGDRLDDVVLGMLGSIPDAPLGDGPARRAEARRLRETLSLQPAVITRLLDGAAPVRLGAAELRAALTPPLQEAVAVLSEVLDAAGDAVPVLILGGTARTPLLAELVDDAGIEGAVVASRPEAAAVLGALTMHLPSAGVVGGTPAARPAAEQPWLPPLPESLRHPWQAAVAILAAAATVAGLLVAGSLLVPAEAPGGLVSSGAAGVLVQYGYRLDLPPGWEHTGGLPERRRILLTPTSAPQGSDLVAVERSPLGYDTAAEPNRARVELRAEYDAAVANGSMLSDYDPSARMAGRDVTTYRQRDGDTVVEWFVVLDGDAQLSVGCRSTPAGVAAVRAACVVVVASVRRV